MSGDSCAGVGNVAQGFGAMFLYTERFLAIRISIVKKSLYWERLTFMTGIPSVRSHDIDIDSVPNFSDAVLGKGN